MARADVFIQVRTLGNGCVLFCADIVVTLCRDACDKLTKNAKTKADSMKNVPRDGSVDLRKAFIDPRDLAEVESIRLQLRQLSDEKLAIASQAHEAVHNAHIHSEKHFKRMGAEMYRAGELPSDVSERYLEVVNQQSHGGPGAVGGMGEGHGTDSTAQYASAWQGDEDRAPKLNRAVSFSGGTGGVTRQPSAPIPSSNAASYPVTSAASMGPGAGGGGGAPGYGGAGPGTQSGQTVVKGPSGGITMAMYSSKAAMMSPSAGMGVAGADNRLGPRGAGGGPQDDEVMVGVGDDAGGGEEEEEGTRKRYCLCNPYKGDTDNMVGCDARAQCAGNEWYHLECLGIRTVPKGHWLCQPCQEVKKQKKAGR